MSVAGTSNLNSLEVDVAKVVVVLVALTKGGLNAATPSRSSMRRPVFG